MKVVRWILIIAISAPMVLAASIYVRNKAVGPSGWAMDDTVKALKAKMKDPDSMVIRSSYTITKPGKDGIENIYICGIVDGKNGFGGYAGGTRFVTQSYAINDSFNFVSATVEDPHATKAARELGRLSGFEKLYWNEGCVDATHPPVSLENP